MSDRPQRRHGPLSVGISIKDVPEALASMRRDLAKLLREVSEDEPPAVRAFAVRVAAIFETGLSDEP